MCTTKVDPGCSKFGLLAESRPRVNRSRPIGYTASGLCTSECLRVTYHDAHRPRRPHIGRSPPVKSKVANRHQSTLQDPKARFRASKIRPRPADRVSLTSHTRALSPPVAGTNVDWWVFYGEEPSELRRSRFQPSGTFLSPFAQR